MNREIKFRGKCIDETTDNGKWIVGSLLQDDYDNCMIVCFADHHEQWYKVAPDTIGQFTGLLNSNGKEIYEGDILMCVGQRADNKNRVYFRTVSFEKGSFYMSDAEYGLSSPLSCHMIDGKVNWEVIGNIHDNMDLLKGGDQ